MLSLLFVDVPSVVHEANSKAMWVHTVAPVILGTVKEVAKRCISYACTGGLVKDSVKKL